MKEHLNNICRQLWIVFIDSIAKFEKSSLKFDYNAFLWTFYT